jgi:hypothetical protein
VQVKDKVLDGVGKHFVGHGCYLLVMREIGRRLGGGREEVEV